MNGKLMEVDFVIIHQRAYASNRRHEYKKERRADWAAYVLCLKRGVEYKIIVYRPSRTKEPNCMLVSYFTNIYEGDEGEYSTVR